MSIKFLGLGGGVREIPSGLLQHVLTVLVFWSWVLLLPRLPPWSRSLRLIPWASVLLYKPLDIPWICCLQLPHHPCKNGTHSTCFYGTGGHTPRVVFWAFGGGGGACRFYFYGRGDFSDLLKGLYSLELASA